MAWSPGPALSHSLHLPNYDQRDPWTQRFISEAANGELTLDENAMNGLETAAGAAFVDLIRKQATKSPSCDNSSWVSIFGQSTGYSRHPANAVKEDPPMMQYEPFRNTYVLDPRCVPQLRYANIRDSRADHDKREAQRHWHRAGRTWSRVPRFRKGETAFTHDPSYKPSQAVGDKWYETEAGPKASLAGRVQQSRWQSSHSMQTGRVPRQPTRSRLPRGPEGAGPGPATYHLQDPWEVKEVCGQVPKSSMFCKPTRRLRPRTASSLCRDPTCHNSISGDASATGGAAANNLPIWGLRPSTAMTAQAQHSRAGLRGMGDSGSGGSPREIKSITSDFSRSRSGHHSPVPCRQKQLWSKTVGPVSFARAERPHVADEPRRREESYGKQVTRLLTRTGDVVVTVNRRRTSQWGSEQDRRRLASCSGDNVATEGDRRSGSRVEIVGPEMLNCRDGGKNRRQSFMNASTNRRVEESITTGTIIGDKDRHGLRVATAQTEAFKLLPEDFSPALPGYREPGRAELPVVFCATTAPISQPRDLGFLHNCPRDNRFLYPEQDVSGDTERHISSGTERQNSGDAEEHVSGNTEQDGVIAEQDRAIDNRGNRKEARTPVRPTRKNKPRRSSDETTAQVARIIDHAQAVVAEQAGPKGTTRIPSPLYRPSGEGNFGDDKERDRASGVAGDGAHDTVSSVLWSDGNTFATMRGE